MRLQEIIGIVREHFTLALIAVTLLGAIFFFAYFILYRKLLGGKREFSRKQLLVIGLFTGYVIMVIGVTFLNRGSNYTDGIELSLFSSYKEAWYSFSVRHWQFVLLNIFMFVPFGLLFPLLHTRFQRAAWTIGAALLFTLSIESFQFMTGYGIFELDDLFNNLLGAIIGYGILMGIITIKEKRLKRALFYFSPLLFSIIAFGSMFTYYHSKEFGNLSIMPIHKMNMAQTAATIDVTPSNNKMTVPIYEAPRYTKKAADEFVLDFFNKLNLDVSDMEIIDYPGEHIYWVKDEESYNIWFHLLDGSYTYSDFSSFDENSFLKDGDEETLKEHLAKFSIDIPQDAQFQKIDSGTNEWTVDKRKIDNQLINGSLTVEYYNDDTIKRIDNQLIAYDKVKDIQIKSEQEAYNELLAGKFHYFDRNKKINTLHIYQVELDYYLDSKGYLQPVYAFESTIDGVDMTILIPGM